MIDSTARALDDEARRMVGAQRRHRQDMRKMWALLGTLALTVSAYAVGAVSHRPCDLSQEGCRWTNDSEAWQTLDGVAWPVCRDESAAGPCLWDASRDGNGAGRSFTVNGDAVRYW